MDHGLILLLPVKTVIKNHPSKELLLDADGPGWGDGVKWVEKRRVSLHMADVWVVTLWKKGEKENLAGPKVRENREEKLPLPVM